MPIQNPHNIFFPESAFGGGLVLPFQEHHPQIGEDVFLAPFAVVIGNVTLGNHANIWFHAVLRGDIAPVEVGEGTNIQDHSMLHTIREVPCRVGRHCTIGHHAILHSCTVEEDCLVGMGAIVLNYAVVGIGSVIGAGAVVTPNTKIPPYSLVLGSPGKVKRTLSEAERKEYRQSAPNYIQLAEQYRKIFR